MSKKPNTFQGYGTDVTTVAQPGVLTIEIIEEMAEKVSQQGGVAQPILTPQQAQDFFRAFNPLHQEKCDKFMSFFHKGVKLKHKGSKVLWEIERTCSHTGTGEVLAVARSFGNKTKEIRAHEYNTYDIVELPPAVKILFGEN